jgi:hypothetical protein
MERTSNLASNLLSSCAFTDGMNVGGGHGVTPCSCLVSHLGGKLQILDPMVSTSELDSTNGDLATVWCGTRVGEGGDTAGGELLQYLLKEGTWTGLFDVVISRRHMLVSGKALPGLCVVGYLPPAHMSRSCDRRSPPMELFQYRGPVLTPPRVGSTAGALKCISKGAHPVRM